MTIRIARMKNGGKRVDLVVLSDSYQLEEVVEVVGPSQPLSLPGGVQAPNGDRSTVEIAGAVLNYLCLTIEGQIVPFLQAKSLQNPEEDAISISLRLGSGTVFKVV